MALTITPFPDLGHDCPEFKLPTTQGGVFSYEQLPKGRPFTVMFICNHCPYVQAIEERLIQLGRDLKEVDIALVAICSNDEESHPEDSFENLKKRSQEKSYSFPYLHDKDQEVAKAFGAVCTPDFFLYDKNHKLAYRGRLDDSWKDASKVTRRELFEAALHLANETELNFEPTPSMGCSIKWV